MRIVGQAERALELMCKRLKSRVAFGKPVVEHNLWHERIAESRLMIEQARLLTLKAAWMIDQVGAKGARMEIAAIKVAAPRVALDVLDRAIQIFGGAGVSDDVPLAQMYALARTLRLADGPDEVHLRDIARAELNGHMSA
jgi:acyl-CoA dehydrogenase